MIMLQEDVEQLKKADSKTTMSFLNDIAATMLSMDFYIGEIDEHLEKAPGLARFAKQVVGWKKLAQDVESKEVDVSGISEVTEVLVAYLPVKDALPRLWKSPSTRSSRTRCPC